MMRQKRIKGKKKKSRLYLIVGCSVFIGVICTALAWIRYLSKYSLDILLSMVEK